MEVLYVSPDYSDLDGVVGDAVSIELTTQGGEVKVACLIPN
jgi:hypothetical protein